MLKISILDTPNQRRLMLEGRLIAPWAAELRCAWKTAQADLHDRALVIDLKNLTAISEDGENALLELLGEGIKFRCSGVFTKHVLKQLAAKHARTVRRRDDDHFIIRRAGLAVLAMAALMCGAMSADGQYSAGTGSAGHNLAKLSLARALGGASSNYDQYLGGK